MNFRQMVQHLIAQQAETLEHLRHNSNVNSKKKKDEKDSVHAQVMAYKPRPFLELLDRPK